MEREFFFALDRLFSQSYPNSPQPIRVFVSLVVLWDATRANTTRGMKYIAQTIRVCHILVTDASNRQMNEYSHRLVMIMTMGNGENERLSISPGSIRLRPCV